MTKSYIIGQLVKALSAIDYAPYAVIEAGETGTIIDTQDFCGEEAVDVRWHRYYARLPGSVTLLVFPELALITVYHAKSLWHVVLPQVLSG